MVQGALVLKKRDSRPQWPCQPADIPDRFRNARRDDAPVENLLFIGDLVSIPHQAIFMEKTNVSAKMATNILLEKAGIRDGRITLLPSFTPSATTLALRMVGSVYLPG